MPRDGSGRAHNAQDLSPETDHNIIHGAGNETDPHVARADKTAELPEHEHGAGLKGLNASGGSCQGLTHGPGSGQGGRGSTN
ncbi:hypothetical protein F4815DRAFT_361598 [Daldinia loculata]|uniref:uncharacterized protein n=1 Tax=Daldinia loculata TaxID=103429 RepID=UPI0020C3937F|nr:uncharacterized protein F4817DRAFT_359234 [Daldinia loculata]KAI1646637.1 hypothetical protein F4817DRAFT_359234 [Daldinia loculata]KAI2776300.1 hypothetical protein F4815DRAFT_361598 [Daldinia loculata]